MRRLVLSTPTPTSRNVRMYRPARGPHAGTIAYRKDWPAGSVPKGGSIPGKLDTGDSLFAQFRNYAKRKGVIVTRSVGDQRAASAAVIAGRLYAIGINIDAIPKKYHLMIGRSEMAFGSTAVSDIYDLARQKQLAKNVAARNYRKAEYGSPTRIYKPRARKSPSTFVDLI